MDYDILTHFVTEGPINLPVVLAHFLRSPAVNGKAVFTRFSTTPPIIPLPGCSFAPRFEFIPLFMARPL